MDFLLNPYIQGAALGAALIVFLIGRILGGVISKFTAERIAISVGFIVAGATCVTIGAFGFADGGPPAWTHATYSYGIPAIAGTVLTGVFASVLTNKEANIARNITWIFVILAMMVSAAFGAYLSSVDKQFSAESDLLDDPLMVGFAALKDKRPDLWDEFSQKWKASEMMGGGGSFELAAQFFQEHMPDFTRVASDDAIMRMEGVITEKMELLSSQNPQACVQMMSGTVPSIVNKLLTYDQKLDEARAMEELIKSAGSGNSGIASQNEAEQVILDAYKNLAIEDPEEFYAVLNAMGGVDVDFASACSGLKRIRQNMLSLPRSQYTRIARSEINLDPNASFSSEFESDMARMHLHAEAAYTRRTLPDKIDPITTFTDMQYSDGTLLYRYELSETIEPDAIRSHFEANSLRPVCSDEYLIEILNLGVIVRYQYADSASNQLDIDIDTGSCASGKLR